MRSCAINIFFRITCMLFLMTSTLTSYAQKKELSLAKSNIKKGVNVDQAEQSMLNLLKDSANRDNIKIWLVLSDAVKKQYELGNEKLYLKQKYDTAALFLSARKMFRVMEQIDSIETVKKNRKDPKYKFRQKNATYLHSYRPNLYYGGLYFISKQKFEQAYDFLTAYIECANLPLFKKYNYIETDTLIPEAAYWAVYSGYKMKDPKATLHHAYLALKDTTHYVLMLQYLAETYKLDNDTTRYVQTLEEGFNHFPNFPFFFPRLVEYYCNEGNWDKALVTTNKALSIDNKNRVFRYTLSSILLNLAKYEDCILICDSLIAEDTTMPEPYLNAGLAYFDQALELDKKNDVSTKRQKKILPLYEKALPYLEKYRELVPDRQEKWALPLYTIYLNLNKGKEFDEIDKLIRKK